MADAPDPPPRKAIPELPKPLADLAPVVTTGTLIWLAVLVFMLVREFGFGHDVEVWRNTALAGCACGIWGLSIVWWQRRASRRGSRGAQQNL